jgi:hypothetical protein
MANHTKVSMKSFRGTEGIQGAIGAAVVDADAFEDDAPGKGRIDLFDQRLKVLGFVVNGYHDAQPGTDRQGMSTGLSRHGRVGLR